MRETWVSQVTGGVQDHTRYFTPTPAADTGVDWHYSGKPGREAPPS